MKKFKNYFVIFIFHRFVFTVYDVRSESPLMCFLYVSTSGKHLNITARKEEEKVYYVDHV